MSIYLGNTKISGNSKELAFPLFTPVWQDHIVNNASWLRSDTFSWQSGAVYVSAYNHLADDLTGITSETETVAGTTITFYRATDGHKIVLPDQETNVSTIYAATGVAWYYILDTTNQRFKLPRSKHQHYGNSPVIGNGMTLGLTNGTVNGAFRGTTGAGTTIDDTLYGAAVGTSGTAVASVGQTGVGVTTDPTKSGMVSTPVEDVEQYKYLYFYVGNTIQDQITIDVGEITEDLNGKADIDLGNLSNDGKIVSARMSMPSSIYVDLSPTSGTTYTAPSDGWVNVRGIATVVNGYAYLSILEGNNYNICYAPAVSYEVGVTLPVRKGQTFTAAVGGATLTRVRFFYAEGSKSEA